MANPSRGLRPFHPTRFGRYTLLTPLATGGMGAVYLARMAGAEGFEKLVVIKKILPHLASDNGFVERFVNEAKIVVKLHHGSIAQVLDMGVEDGEYYIAMEFVDGKDVRKLAALCRDARQPVPPSLALYVTVRVLDALAYAHRKKDEQERELNLVHRDISPQNILISYEGEVKVIDFGLAKSAKSLGHTNPSVILGKFFYMSPEQARHQGADKRSDLYATGICLWELLAGRNPFDSIRPGELMHAVANPRIPRISDAVPGIPESLDQALMKALEVDPAARYATAEEMRGRLTSVMLEIDSSAGPEALAGFMRRQFAREYDNERRALAALARVKLPDDPADAGDRPVEPAPLAFQNAPAEQRDLTAAAIDPAPLLPSTPEADRWAPIPIPEPESSPEPRPRAKLRPALAPPVEPPTAAAGPDSSEFEGSDSELILIGQEIEPQEYQPPADRPWIESPESEEAPPGPAPAEPVQTASPPASPASRSRRRASAYPPKPVTTRRRAPRRGRIFVVIGVACLVAALAILASMFGLFPGSATLKIPLKSLSPVPVAPATPEAATTVPDEPPSPAPPPTQPATPRVLVPLEPATQVETAAPKRRPGSTKAVRPAPREASSATKELRATRQRAALERQYEQVTQAYDDLRQLYPCEQLGFVCKVFKPEVEESYRRMISMPDEYPALEKLLNRYRRAIEDRRRTLGPSEE